MKNLAALKDSEHICPKSDGNKPHKGGKVISASTDVYIENRQACREGDQLQCKSPDLDNVKKGSGTVYINGSPAARLKDTTNHGGKIIGNGASTVYIG